MTDLVWSRFIHRCYRFRWVSTEYVTGEWTDYETSVIEKFLLSFGDKSLLIKIRTGESLYVKDRGDDEVFPMSFPFLHDDG